MRRRVVVGITLVIGAVLLGFSLNVAPGGVAFYPLTVALAATWVIGGFASGPLHLGRINFRGELRRPIILPILLGLATAAVFILGAVIVRNIEPLRNITENVLAFARYGSLPLVALVTLINGIAEEIFFRGALFAAIGVWHPVAISTVIYTLTTVATGNVMLVFSAALLGVLLGPATPGQRRHPRPDPDALHLVDDHAVGPAAGLRRRRLSQSTRRPTHQTCREARSGVLRASLCTAPHERRAGRALAEASRAFLPTTSSSPANVLQI